MAGQAITRALTTTFGAMNSDNGLDKDSAPDKTGQDNGGAFPTGQAAFRQDLAAFPNTPANNTAPLPNESPLTKFLRELGGPKPAY
jgi:hypothetical protein